MTIEERAEAYKQKIQDEASLEGVEILAPNAYYAGYKQGASEQRAIDIENCVKWCEDFNHNAEMTGCEQRIDVDSFRQMITNMIHDNP